MQTLQGTVVVVAGLTFGQWLFETMQKPRYRSAVVEGLPSFHHSLFEKGEDLKRKSGTAHEKIPFDSLRRFDSFARGRAAGKNFLVISHVRADDDAVFYFIDIDERHPTPIFPYGHVAEACLENEDE